MTRNVDDIIDTTHDPKEAILITTSTVAGEIHPGNITPVLTFESFGIPVDRAHHRRPRRADNQKAALICADGVSLTIDDIGDDPRQRPCCRTGFRRHGTWN